MKQIIKFICGLLLIISVRYNSYSQSCTGLNIQHQSDIASTCNFMVMTMIHDQLNRPYLYVANKEAGLKVYDITVITSPVLVATVSINSFDTLHAMNVSQNGNYLYLAIGNTFTNPQKGGMAIIDITNPASPVVTDYYVVPGSASGAGIVKVEGNYAYLGAMKSGLVILDVTTKNNIQFVSKFIPSINYPPISSPNPNLYNARGMEVKNSIVYLCYDAGGFRVINCTNKLAPVETGHWCNPVMYSPLDHPKAYNNIVIDDTLAYIAVDYCGMEVLNITDTSNIKLFGWWNPYNCPNNNWFSSPVHSNEIQYDQNCKHVFLSTGKSDMMVIDVANPAQPDSCNMYGGVANSIGTWGVGLYQNQIYLSYICAAIPFSSNWTGVKLLTYTPCTTGINELDKNKLIIYPNPSTNEIAIKINDKIIGDTYFITDVLGRELLSGKLTNELSTIDIESFAPGVYFIQLKENANDRMKFLKE